MTSTLETKAAALEGLDFIETEEDVKAVEAATLKIQSTFRGKKIRSKITTPKPTSQTSSTTSSSGQQQRSEADQKQKPRVENRTAEEKRSSSSSGSKDDNNNELSRKVAEMQVQDNNDNNNQMDGQHQKPAANTPSGLPGEEAERAATKIQAGFKGYKTRKELEGKLPPTSSSSGQQEATTE